MAEQSSKTQPPEEISSTGSQLTPEVTPVVTPDQPESSGGWWDSLLSSAKAKSAEVYTMVKKDLDEIGTAMKSEANLVFSTTSSAIGKTLKLDEPESPANIMKKSFSSFIGQVSTVLNPEPDDDDTEVILATGDTTMASTYKLELEGLQRVDATFIVPATGPEFDAWKKSLDLQDGEVISALTASRRLEAYPILKSQYQRLVPDAVSHDEFWERYLYRVALLQDRLAAASRKQPIEHLPSDPVMAHLPMQTPESPEKSPSIAEAAADSSHDDLGSSVAWDDAEDFNTDLELTEEQQISLLEEYEKEISSKKHKQKDIIYNKSTSQVSPVKSKKSSLSGGKNKKSELSDDDLVEDYFADRDNKDKNVVKPKEIKDDVSSNSDESWEKEFDNVDETQSKT